MILGLTGPAGAGTVTVADRLCSTDGFKKLSFAGILKRMLVAGGMPEPSRELKEDLIPGLPFTWRDAAQKLGTEWGRGLDPDLWVKLTMSNIPAGGNWVLSDVRFPNEALAVRKSGYLVHISGRKVVLHGGTAAHVSEAGIRFEDGDQVINNAANMDSLLLEVATLVGELHAH